VDSKQASTALNKTFQQLYRWALAGFRAKIADCRQRREKGQPWSDPSSAHTSWKDIDRQVEKALQAASGTADFGAVCQVGDKALKMLNGFTVGNGKTKGNGLQPTVYDNPLKPPDFEKLKKRFELGEVLIKVESRKSAAESTPLKRSKV
jgi:hypothetical protein